MRKVMFMLLLTTSIVLTGCNLIDDTPLELSQQFCLENPDHELCDIDALEDVELDAVEILVQDAFTKINGDGCPDIVFAGNKELLDTCTNDPMDLIPDGVTSFDPMYSKQDAKIYAFFGNTNIEGLQLEVKISVVEVDGKTYIDDWKATKVMIESDSVSDLEAMYFLEKLYKDFGDSNISNDDFCMMYYDGIDNDCDGIRDSFFDYNEEITDHTFKESNGTGFLGHVTVLKAMGGTTEQGNVDVETHVFRQDFGPVRVSRITPDTSVTSFETDSFFDVFFDLYSDQDVSTDQFCERFYDNRDNDCDGLRDSFFEDNTDITDFDLTAMEGLEFRGHVTVLKAMGGTEDSDIIITLTKNPFGPIQISSLVVVQEVDILGMGEEKLSMLLPNLFGTTWTDQELIDTYKIVHLPDRTMFPMDEFDSFIIVDKGLNDDGSADFRVQVKFKAGAELSKKVNIALDDDSDGDGLGDLIVRFIEPELVDPDIDIPVIEAYISSYFDTTLDNDTFFNMYHTSGSNHPDLMNRTANITAQYTYNIYQSNGKYYVELTGETESMLLLWRLEVRVNRWEVSIMIDINDIDNDCDGVCEVEVTSKMENKMIFEWFLRDFKNSEISDDELTMKYFGTPMEQDFYDIRKEVQEKKLPYMITNVIGVDGLSNYIYLIDTGDMNNRNGEPVKVKVMKRIDKSSPLLLIFDDDTDSPPTDLEVTQRLSDFRELSNHMSVAYTEMCRAYTPDHRIDECAMMISSKVAMGYQLTTITRLQQRPDLLVMEWDNAVGERITETYNFFTYYAPDGTVLFELIPYIPLETELLEAAFLPYVESLNNMNHGVDETCMLVDESSQDECLEMKTYLLATSHQVMITNVYYDMDTLLYVMEFSIYQSDQLLGSIEYDVSQMPDSPLHKDRGTRGTNPLFE